MSDLEFEDVLSHALQLSPAEQARLVEHLAASMRAALDRNHVPESFEASWTAEEVIELMKIEPLTGAEIIAAGLTGGWEDMGITDGAEWVNEQKRKRRAKWKL